MLEAGNTVCGIVGCWMSKAEPRQNLSSGIEKAIAFLEHRGPDDKGQWIDPTGRLILSHCRLAIIDTTAAGHQPMVSSCGRYVIALNGEIYNYIELRKELKSSGHQLSGNSDTEVFLEAVAQWGLPKALDRVLGMFAFALFDKVEDKLYLVKDRLGKKPLYYIRVKSILYFASEIKALKTLIGETLQLDICSLNHYLTFGYVPSPRTIYKGILEIPPAHIVVCDNHLSFDSKPYWKLEWQPKHILTFDEASEQVEALLKDSIRLRLRADVPVGCFLSGGIDSGLIVAFASKYASKELVTLTVGTNDESVDESPLAEIVAKMYGTRHNVLEISPDVRNDLPKVVAAYDEPFADASAIPSYLISREAKKYVKVILNGDGGDEVFGGYRRHRAISLLSRYRFLFSAIPKSWLFRLNSLLSVPGSFRSSYAFGHRFLRGIAQDPFDRYVAWGVDGFDENEKFDLWIKQRQPFLETSNRLLVEKFGDLKEFTPIDQFMAMDILLNLPDGLIVKMDIATMAHGLEARSPFLDHRIVEYAAKLPAEVKLKGWGTKPILRKIAEKYLPESVVSAPKRGFEIPLISWLRGDLADMVTDVCLSSNGIILQLFKKNKVEDLIAERLDLDPGRWARRVWILFMLGMWDQLNGSGFDID